jgi:hypothetical protein
VDLLAALLREALAPVRFVIQDTLLLLPLADPLQNVAGKMAITADQRLRAVQLEAEIQRLADHAKTKIVFLSFTELHRLLPNLGPTVTRSGFAKNI